MQAVARHLISRGHQVEACCDWPALFAPLGDRVTVSAFRRERIDRLAHYSLRRHIAATDQFQDCCLQAGIDQPVELRLDWVPQGGGRLLAPLQAKGKPIIAVPLPRAPMDRTDGYGRELLPDCAAIQRAIDRIKGRATIVQLGAGQGLYRFDGIDLDLANATSVSELIDVAATVDGFLGYVSFLVPLAASLQKPALFVWSRRGLASPDELIRRLTPRKVLHGPRLAAIADDCTGHELAEAIDALCGQA